MTIQLTLFENIAQKITKETKTETIRFLDDENVYSWVVKTFYGLENAVYFKNMLEVKNGVNSW